MADRPVAEAQDRGRVVYGVTVGASAFVLLRGQLAWLKNRGWDVHLVTTGDDMAARAAERENVPLHPIPMRRGISLLHDMSALARWIQVLIKLRPEIVNVGTPKASLVGGLAAWLCRVPRRVYVVRGLRLEGAAGPLGAWLWLMEWLTIRLVTDVVVVSPSLAREMHRRRIFRPGRAWLIGNGSSNGVRFDQVEAQVAATDRQLMRAKLGIAAGDFVVGYVGRMSADKGVDTLVNAVRPLLADANIRLLLIGRDEDGQTATWIDSLAGQAIHVGWTDDVWPYYAAMDALCLPTKREGFPNVVLEAAAAGIPTITTNATGAVDSVIDGVTGLIVPVNDVTALTRAIAQLADEPVSTRTMGDAARRHVKGNYDPEQIWLGLESLLLGSPLRHVRRI